MEGKIGLGRNQEVRKGFTAPEVSRVLVKSYKGEIFTHPEPDDEAVVCIPSGRNETTRMQRGELRLFLHNKFGSLRKQKLAGEFEGFLLERGSDLLDAFHASKSFERTREEASREGHRLQEQNYWPELAGMVFSKVAHLSLAARLEDPILTGDQALDLMKLRYPNAEVVEDPFGTTSLRKKYVPDGLIMASPTRIGAFIEYKSRREIDPERLEKQYFGYRSLLRDFAGFYDMAPPLLLVTSANTDLPIAPPQGVQQIRMPFSTRQLGKFLNEHYPWPTPRE